MRQENAVRQSTPAQSTYRGLHLVTPESIMALRVTESKSMETPKSSRKVQISRKVQARRNDRISTIWLGIAAFSAPAIWIGHALLRHMHVL